MGEWREISFSIHFFRTIHGYKKCTKIKKEWDKHIWTQRSFFGKHTTNQIPKFFPFSKNDFVVTRQETKNKNKKCLGPFNGGRLTSLFALYKKIIYLTLSTIHNSYSWWKSEKKDFWDQNLHRFVNCNPRFHEFIHT